MFTGFSIVCGLSTTLTMMIIGRVGQGFTGGAMIPTAHDDHRHAPAAPPAAGGHGAVRLHPDPGAGDGSAGRWLADRELSWHYAFFINIPICILLMVFLTVGLTSAKMRLEELSAPTGWASPAWRWAWAG
jgi:DHA2 family multidrug resistance protein